MKMPESPSPRVKLSTTAHGSVRIEVHAKPRARKTRVVGVHGDALSVAIAAPPLDGAANDEVVRVLAELFGVARGHVTLIRGATARMKLFDVTGTDVDAMRRALDRHH
jgi:uncharacterized protein (TIGR00251 family)